MSGAEIKDYINSRRASEDFVLTSDVKRYISEVYRGRKRKVLLRKKRMFKKKVDKSEYFNVREFSKHYKF